MRTVTKTETITFAEWLHRAFRDGTAEADWANHYLNTGEGHFQFGKRVLVDREGSDLEVLRFNTYAEAETWMSDHLLPDAFDAFVDARSGWVYCEDIGRCDGLLGKTYPTTRRAMAALRLAMHRSGVYPTVWITGLDWAPKLAGFPYNGQPA